MYSIPHSLTEGIAINSENLFTSMINVLDNAMDYFSEENDYLFGLHLSKAQAYRIHGEYDLAIAEIAVASDIATEDSQLALADKLDCIFNAESIMVANTGKDEWPEDFAQCNYFGEAEGIQRMSNNTSRISNEKLEDVKIIAQPNPTSNSVLITSKNATSDFKSIDVFDTYGRLVLQLKSKDTWNIQVGGLANGVYFIQVYFENGTSEQTRILKSE